MLPINERNTLINLSLDKAKDNLLIAKLIFDMSYDKESGGDTHAIY